MVLAFDLVPVQLVVTGCDIRVLSVAPCLEEVRLDGELLLCCDDEPCLELLHHRLNVLIFLTQVVLFELFHVLRVNGRDDGFDLHGIYHLLKILLLPVDLVVLL